MRLLSISSLLLVMTLLSGCENPLKKDKEAAVTPTPGTTTTPTTYTPITLADAVNSYDGECVPMTSVTHGSAFNGFSYKTTLGITNSGTLEFTTFVYDGSTCNLPNNRILEYFHGGSVTFNGLATTPTGATKMTFSQQGGFFLTVRSAGMKTLFDSACGMSFTLNSGSSMILKTCTHASMTTQSFGPVGMTLYNVGKLDSGVLETGLPTQFFKFGDPSTAPTTLGYDFTKI